MNAEQIAEGRRLEEAATDGPLESRLIRIRDAEDRNWREIFSRGEGLAVVMADWYERIRGGEAETYCGVRIKKADADLFVWLRNHACELLAAAERLEAIVALARQYCHPGCNPGSHGLASQILRIAGERPERSE